MQAVIPNWDELARLAPAAMVCCTLIYYGWWLRGNEVRVLREQLEYFKKKMNGNGS